MELFRVIKRDSRALLRLFFGRSLASIFVTGLSYFAVILTEAVLLFVVSGSFDFHALLNASPKFTVIVGISSLLYYLVMPALLLGRTKLFLSLARGEGEELSAMFDMFSSVKKFFGSFFFGIGYTVRVFLVFFAAAIPGFVLIFVTAEYMPFGSATLDILRFAAYCIGIALFFLCFSLGIIFIQRWSLAPYYRASGVGVHKAFVLSKKASRGLCTFIVNFKLSFVGWGFLSLLILPLLWTLPYYFTANTLFAKYLMERYERSLAEVPEHIFE